MVIPSCDDGNTCVFATSNKWRAEQERFVRLAGPPRARGDEQCSSKPRSRPASRGFSIQQPYPKTQKAHEGLLCFWWRMAPQSTLGYKPELDEPGLTDSHREGANSSVGIPNRQVKGSDLSFPVMFGLTGTFLDDRRKHASIWSLVQMSGDSCGF